MTTTVTELMKALRAKDVRLWIDGGQLAFEAPVGALSPADFEQLRAHKPAILDLLRSVRAPAEGGAIERADRARPPRLSLAQQRLWFIGHLAGAGAAYHIQTALRLSGPLDTRALREALDALVARHEILRTTLHRAGGDSAVQVIAEEGRFALRSVDLHPQAAPSDRELRRIASDEARAPFDWEAGPLARGVLIRASEREHVLILTVHHIVADGWSLGLLVQEWAEIYAALHRGQPASLPPLPIQYADYAEWERRWVTADAAKAQRDYWSRQLAGAPSTLDLPTDRPRPAVQRYEGASLEIVLDARLSEGLRALARRHDVTVFMALFAGFAIVLSRLSGQDDVCVGVPLGNRRVAQTERVVGLFANTVVLRARLDDDPSVSDLLRRVKEATLGAHAAQELPFEQVIDALRPPRSLSHTPLFQAMFVFQNTPRAEVRLPGVHLTSRASPRDGGGETLTVQETSEFVAGGIDTARFDLTLSLEDDGERIVGAINYASALFDRATIERWARSLAVVFEGMVKDPASRVSAVPLLDDGERRLVVEAFNATRVEYPGDERIHQVFEAQARATPDAAAIVYEDAQLTYRELDGRANRVARALRARGAAADGLVAVMMDRSVEMVVALLGVLKSGAAYVPIDPSYPRARIEAMLAAARPIAVLTQARFEEAIPGGAEAIALDRRWEEIAALDGAPIEPSALDATPRSLAYVIYTSGSTGEPKGAMNEHRAVMNRLRWMQDAYRLTSADRILQKTPFGFDVSVWEFFWPLLHGARLVVARPRGHQDPWYLSRLIQDAGVTVAHFVPSMLQAFLECSEARACAGLRRIVCSGEELTWELVRRAWEVLPGAALSNLYGPTEAAIDVTHWECHPRADLPRVPIGQPIANVRIYVLDAERRPTPIGVAGEIYIGGAGVGRGYLNRPDLTEQRFLPDPFSDDPGARLYRTGDRGRWRSDGTLEYLGRLDHQVKLRGFRIELGDVEAHLRKQPGVKEAVVVVQSGASGERQLVAYLTPRGDAEALRGALKESLPEYMVPSAFVFLDAIPLGKNGKVDRRRLPAPSAAPDRARRLVAPRDEAETALARIWGLVLGVENVGVEDDFFTLGGDSILALRVVERARREGLAFSLEDFFRHPTIAALRRALSDGGAAGEGHRPIAPFGLLAPAERAAIERDPNAEDAYPLSALQAGMHFHSELHRSSSVYHDIFSICVERPFSPALFDQAVTALVRRHPILRSSFQASADNRLLQIVHRSVRDPLRVESIAHLSHEDQDAFVDRWMAEEKARRIAWAEAPLLRVFVHVRGGERFQCSLSFHHAILDGWSLASLLTELFEQYVGSLSGADASPPAPRSLFRDFVALELRSIESRVTRDFWRRHLDDAAPLVLPSGNDRRGAQPGMDVAIHDVDLPLSTCRKIRESARDLGVSLKVALLAAHVKVLSVASGQRDILTGLVSNGRIEEEDGDRALGLYLNSLPFRTKLGGGTWADLLRQVHQIERDTFPHRRCPLHTIQQDVGGETLINTLFNFVHFHVYQRLFDAGMVQVPRTRVFEQTNFDLMVVFSQALTGDGISLQLAYDPAILSPDQIDRMAAYYRSALQAIGERVQTPHDAATLLTRAEQEQRVRWNATEASYPRDVILADLFREQARKTPGATALVCGKARISYEDLDRRSDLLAGYLAERGVGPEGLVAICAERGVEMVVAMLGTLKAGGAYVPVDPAYPAERIEFMLADAAPRVILTQERLAATLPKGAAPVTALDAGWDEIQRCAAAPGAAATQANAAYMIYTSGSTGKPKGVVIEHGNAVNFVCWALAEFSPAELSATLFSTSINFDLSIFELFVPLAAGGTVYLVPNALALDEATAAAVTLVNTVPSAMSTLLDTGTKLASARVINLAGEALPRELVERIFAQTTADCVVNLYGPTEATTYSTYVRMTRARGFEPHIGRPVANTQVYILDAGRQPVPVGVAGEIYIGGAGVARGYQNRPDLTEERFLADLAGGAGRAYRTGDLGRFRADGSVEYLGRNDHQVKIRGFRIELGEIDAQLRRHPAVKDVAVIVREDEAIGRHVVACVVGDEDRLVAVPEEQSQVDTWQTVFEGEYVASGVVADARDDYAGWRSSFTGAPLGRDEMRAWADLAVRRIAALPSTNVLEIGCGVGLLLFRLLPQVASYVGTDFSAHALDTLAARLPAGAREKVDLVRCDAADFTALRGRRFDTVILNSVVQYFPSVEYLLDVLALALDHTSPGGAVFVGDVRNYALLEAFAASVAVAKAAPDEAIEAVSRRVKTQINTEGELLVAPAFFAALPDRLPRVSHVEVLPKLVKGYDNELFTYRYDVVLHVEREVPRVEAQHLDWSRDRITLASLADHLTRERPACLRVTGIPNPRLQSALAAQMALLGGTTVFKTVGSLLEALAPAARDGAAPGAPDLDDLAQLAREASYHAEPSWLPCGPAGEYAVTFTPEGAPRVVGWLDGAGAPRVDIKKQATQPLKNRRAARLSAILKQHAEEHLPDPMRPAFYAFFDALPLTPNGKVDRKALAAAAAEAEAIQRYEGAGTQADDAPQGEIEEGLANIWKEILGVSRVGRHDNFFDLGGHSLLAAQVTHRIYVVLGWDVEVTALFDAPTVCLLAAQFQAGGAAARAPIERIERGRPVVLSAAQRRIWSLSRREGAGVAYRVAQAVRFKGALDRAALLAALDEIVARHEVLRTRYVEEGGAPWQVIDGAPRFALTEIDLGAHSEVERDRALAQQMIDEARAPFDLTTGPVIRGRLLRLSEDEHVFAFTAHGIVYDGWSRGALIRELGALYVAHRDRAASTLPALPIQYADYAAWQHEWLHKGLEEGGLAYWEERLAGAPAALQLPTDRARPEVQSFAGAAYKFKLDADLGAGLKALTRRQDATMYMTVLTAFAILMSKLSGQDDVVIGAVVANRQRSDLEGLIGAFVNYLPLRVQIEGDPTARELSQRVKEVTLGGYAHQEVPFWEIVEHAGGPPRAGRSPVFQVTLMLDNVPESALRMPGIALDMVETPIVGSEFDLSLSLKERPDGIEGHLVYATDLFDQRTVQRWMRLYEAVLRGMVEDVDRRVSALG